MSRKTPEQISYNMQQVKCKGSKIEVMLMKELWSRGLRYRKNVTSICGKPDIVFIGKENSGTTTTGKKAKRILNLTKSFGYLR